MTQIHHQQQSLYTMNKKSSYMTLDIGWVLKKYDIFGFNLTFMV